MAHTIILYNDNIYHYTKDTFVRACVRAYEREFTGS